MVAVEEVAVEVPLHRREDEVSVLMKSRKLVLRVRHVMRAPDLADAAVVVMPKTTVLPYRQRHADHEVAAAVAVAVAAVAAAMPKTTMVAAMETVVFHGRQRDKVVVPRLGLRPLLKRNE